ncbi:MAG: hypothetical protein AB1426_00565 [Bacillota bacterium]
MWNNFFSFREITTNLIANIIASLAVMVFVLFQGHFKRLLLQTANTAFSLITGRKFIFLWNDVDIAISKQIVKFLEKSQPNFHFQVLQSPKDILNYILSPKTTGCVILIITDVTKLSEDVKIRDRIQKSLLNYVYKGGGIIGTHDIVYRRVRNQLLENIFGCQLNCFLRTDKKIEYIKNPDFVDHPFCRDLPERFSVSDGEIVWGNWSPDALPLFSTEDGKPLVIAREYAKGRIV